MIYIKSYKIYPIMKDTIGSNVGKKKPGSKKSVSPEIF